MRAELRRVLEQVARRARQVNLWLGLAACWLTLAIVAGAVTLLGPWSIEAPIALAAIALVSGCACFMLVRRTARNSAQSPDALKPSIPTSAQRS